jgi:hypothetical protein
MTQVTQIQWLHPQAFNGVSCEVTKDVILVRATRAVTMSMKSVRRRRLAREAELKGLAAIRARHMAELHKLRDKAKNGSGHARRPLIVADKPVAIPREQSGWSGKPGWSGAPRPFFIPDSAVNSVGRIQ